MIIGESKRKMDKALILEKIKKEKIIAVLRIDEENKALNVCKTLIGNGVNCLELAFNSFSAIKTFKAMLNQFADKALIGAGTILDDKTAELAISLGARFILSPIFNKSVADICNKNNIIYIPGIATPKEAYEAMQYGCNVVKLFPASNFKPTIIKDLKGPFNNLEIIPFAGINTSNIKNWLDAGAFACGVGNDLIGGYKLDDYELIYKKCKEYKELIK